MKLAITALASALGCCVQVAAAATGHVYMYDPTVSSGARAESRLLSPVTARMVLAQRAGVEDYHIEKALNEEEMSAINDFGSRAPLFGQKDRIRRAFILSLGKDHESDVASRHASSSFEISPAPAAAATEGLFYDLAQQVDPSTTNAGDVIDANGDLYITVSSISDLEGHFLRLLEEETWSITALAMPSYAYARTGSGSYQWGTYSMPASQSMLQKRKAPSEEPLSAPVTHISPNLPSVPASSNQTGPLPGILPWCFASMSACQSSTRNCTGHGSCRKLYTDRDAHSGKNGDCFACSCGATKAESSDGKVKTTYWAGPACQKQDASTAFWLIALFTVGMVGAVSFAVGTVWSMGSEELPSVIGAGVSGPVRK